MSDNILYMDRDLLVKNLTAWAKIVHPRNHDEAILSFDGSVLIVDTRGATIKTPACGTWDGEFRVCAAFLAMIAKVAHPKGPIIFCIKDDRLRVNTSSTPCVSQPTSKALIHLPIDADTAVYLALKLRYSMEQIKASGFLKSLQAAESQCNRDICSAEQALSKYGVREEDLRALVDQALIESGLTAKV